MTQSPTRKIKVCYVLAYKEPEYIRTKVILNLLNRSKKLAVVTAINSQRSFLLRYVETLAKLIITRIIKRPQVYVLGFRGHEIYWLVRILTFPKPIVFDEFLNMQDWLVSENHKLKEGSFAAKLACWYTRSILKSSSVILADTKLHAKSSSETYSIPLEKYLVLYVGTDENLFYPRNKKRNNTELNVFFYGNMAPLHGVEHILEAAKNLASKPIKFLIVGGKGKKNEPQRIEEFIHRNKLKNITYKRWIDFGNIPQTIADSDLFIGGPLGDTLQSRRVITGKTFQSLAMGAPTLIGGIEENVGFEDKKNCLIVDQGSSEALARAIVWANDNIDKLSRIGNEGERLYQAKFSTAAQADKLEDIILSFV